jgi:hypothetical protein
MKNGTSCGLLLLWLALTAFAFVPGCGPGAEENGDDHDEHAEHADHGEHDGEDHHADEGEHPEHGKNGGHIVAFDCDGRHAEWIEDKEGEGSVLVIMLDADKEEAAIAADSPMNITTTLEGEPSQTFELTAESQTDGKASRFRSTKAGILAAIDIAHEGDGEITLTVEIDGQTCKSKLVPHEH